ncbi:MAG: NTP transferase domain-containing protein [Bacteroidaceae bacterium]|nr:NTP transferase domain-containing protein [Bacteroidaceae bacterium]
MNILIFAAGLGTRLKPLTDSMPKALVPIKGKSLLGILIDKIKKSSDEEKTIVVNIHHFGQQIIDYVAANNSFGVDVRFSDERDMLLETGGGLKKAAPLFDNDKPILIHNVDILSNVDLGELYNTHASDSEVGATLIVSERNTKRYLLFDESDHLVGWTNIETGEIKSPYPDLKVSDCKKYAFSGIHVFSQSLLKYMKDWNGKFSIIDFYLSICDKVVIKGDFRSDLRVLDVGKLDSIKLAENWLEQSE